MKFRIITALGTLAALNACGGTTDSTTDSSATELASTAASLHEAHGAVFTESNELGQNRVFAFARQSDGSLSEPVAYATEGGGSGDSLGSQAAVRLSEDGRWLLVVNAGSNDVSVFAVRGAALELTGRTSSGGVRPISVAEHRGVVYVLNAGGTGNISGFWLSPRGQLRELPGSARPLSGPATGPAQIEFSPDGRALVVSEKTANHLDVYRATGFGFVQGPNVFDSAGKTPFGFDFTRRGDLIVSEAASASLSSYDLSRGGALVLESGVVPDGQAAPCWVAISGDDRYAFTANAGSSSISSYVVERDGQIRLVSSRAGETGAGSTPLDMALDASGRFLYVLDRGNAVVSGFDVEASGHLAFRQSAGALPAFATGLAAR